MALEIDIENTPIGLAINGAYARIVDATGGPQQVQYRVAVFASEAARRAGAEPVEVHAFSLSRSDATDAFFKALYEDLKAQPRFAGGRDK